jgi:integrase
MAITSYIKRGETLFKVRVQIQSSRFSSIRINEQVSRIKSEAEAQRVEQKLKKEIEKKVLVQELRRNMTGQTWRGVLEHWYETQNNVRVRFGSISQYVLDDYYNCMKKRMALFDHTPCADIKPIDLMQLFNEMTDQGVSLSHRKKMRTIIKSVFEHGVQAGLINILRNPVHELVLKKSEEKKPEILTIVEIRHLIEVAFAKKHEWRHVWALALLTGMRNGELFALQWSDIDWDNKLITVSRSYNCRSKNIGSTKAGYWRDVPIS